MTSSPATNSPATNSPAARYDQFARGQFARDQFARDQFARGRTLTSNFGCTFSVKFLNDLFHFWKPEAPPHLGQGTSAGELN